MSARSLEVSLAALSPARLSSILPAPIASAVRDEIHRSSGTYYAEFEELYHIYSGWEELADRYLEEYNSYKEQKNIYLDEIGSYIGQPVRPKRARVDALNAQRELLEKDCERLRLLLEGPVGLCLLRRRYLAEHHDLDKGAYLTGLLSLREQSLVSKVSRFFTRLYDSATAFTEGPSWPEMER